MSDQHDDLSEGLNAHNVPFMGLISGATQNAMRKENIISPSSKLALHAFQRFDFVSL